MVLSLDALEAAFDRAYDAALARARNLNLTGETRRAFVEQDPAVRAAQVALRTAAEVAS